MGSLVVASIPCDVDRESILSECAKTHPRTARYSLVGERFFVTLDLADRDPDEYDCERERVSRWLSTCLYSPLSWSTWLAREGLAE